MELSAGYKNTEVGIIPEDWEAKELGEVANISMGQSPIGSSYNQNEDGIALINGPTEFTEKYPIKKQWTNLPTKLCKSGDILICVRGSSTGRMNISNDEYCIGRGVAALWAKSNYNNYLLEYLTNNAVSKILSLTSGSTFPNIDGKSLRSIKIAVPKSFAEQTAIASALSDADALISSLEKLISKKRNIKQGAMQELLQPKEGWEVKKLGEVAEIDMDNLGADTNPDFTFQYISLEDVDTGLLKSMTELKFINAPSRARRKIKKGDILMSTVRPNLKSHLLIKDDISNWVCSTGFSVLRCDDKLADKNFVFHHLFAPIINRQIETLISGSNYPAINSKEIKALKIPFPPLAEQTHIATILSDMDNEITALEDKLEKYRKVKLGMMQNLLTGKIRLI